MPPGFGPGGDAIDQRPLNTPPSLGTTRRGSQQAVERRAGRVRPASRKADLPGCRGGTVDADACLGVGMRKRCFRLAGLSAVMALAAAGAAPVGGTQGTHAAVVAADPADWTPVVLDGRVRAIVPVDDRIVVGGEFSQVQEAGSGEVLPRRNLFAFDAATGVVDRLFRPRLDGPVEALAAGEGRSVFVGGRFGTVNETERNRLAKLDVTSGSHTPGFEAVVSGSSITDLAVHQQRLFLGGRFSAVNGTPRGNLAVLDTTSGAVDPNVDVPFAEARQGRAGIEKLAVTPDGSQLVAVGNFTRVAGEERPQLAVVDLASRPARLADWHTDRYSEECSLRFDTYMRDVDVSPDGSYFVVVTTGARAAPTLCDAAARWELTSRGSGLQPTWADHSGGDSLTAVAVTGAAVYVGGHQRWMNNPDPRGSGRDTRPGPGAVPRQGIAALDPSNGLPFSWNPGRQPRGEGVFAFVATPSGLWVGSDTPGFGGEDGRRLAFCPLAGGTPVRPPPPITLPGDLYNVDANGELSRRTFDGSTAGERTVVDTAGNWSAARGAFLAGDTLYTGRDDGRLEARRFDSTGGGQPREVDRRGLTASHFDIADLTGAFLHEGRLYYTLDGESKLFYRYFTAESEVVGAEEFEVSGEGDGIDWADVRGLFHASGRLYFARSDGNLYAVEFAGGRPGGAPGLVSGPARDGHRFGGLAMFLVPR